MARWPMAFRRRAVRLALVASWASAACQAFYLPGVSPTEHLDGAKVEMKVNKLTSAMGVLPFDYYSLPFCKPAEVTQKSENIGEILAGDVIQSSSYEIHMRVNTTCQVLCTVQMDADKLSRLQSAIQDEYMVNWIVDNLPAGTMYRQNVAGGAENIFLPGFPVGVKQEGRFYVYNHVVLVLSYHSNPDKYEGYRVVGFQVQPYSSSGCTEGDTVLFELAPSTKEIAFTYGVRWIESDVRWASRWDLYLNMTSGGEVHWFGILNSLVMLTMLTGAVAGIMLRTLYRDIAKYNEIVDEEEAKEETGWKLVHADVFRPPEYSSVLCAFIGSGVQLIGMASVVLIFALLGFISPARRGALLQSMMLCFTLMGLPGGHAAAKFYQLFRNERQMKVLVLTSLMYPGFVFAVFFVLNLFIWSQGSSGAVPLTTMLAMMVMWFGISMPLVLLGGRMGFQQAKIELPTRISVIPRCVPEQSWIAWSAWAVGGILPFGAVFPELYFILSSIWNHRFYYLFGFLGVVIVIFSITCAEISIALSYYQLTQENHKWWWRAVFNSGSSAIYMFLYSVLYSRRLNISTTVATIVYYGYMALLSSAMFIFTGTIGVGASFFFVRGIYGSIKVD